MSYWINENWIELEYFIFLIKLKGWVLLFEILLFQKKKTNQIPYP